MGRLLSYLGIASSEELATIKQQVNNIGKSLNDITITQKIVKKKLDELNSKMEALSSSLHDRNNQIDNHLSKIDSSNATANKKIAIKVEEISLSSNQFKHIYEKMFEQMINLHQEITTVKDKQLHKADIELLEECIRLILATQIMNNVEYTLEKSSKVDVNQEAYQGRARGMDI